MLTSNLRWWIILTFSINLCLLMFGSEFNFSYESINEWISEEFWPSPPASPVAVPPGNMYGVCTWPSPPAFGGITDLTHVHISMCVCVCVCVCVWLCYTTTQECVERKSVVSSSSQLPSSWLLWQLKYVAFWAALASLYLQWSPQFVKCGIELLRKWHSWSGQTSKETASTARFSELAFHQCAIKPRL